jgi:hypothetical protein
VIRCRKDYWMELQGSVMACQAASLRGLEIEPASMAA